MLKLIVSILSIFQIYDVVYSSKIIDSNLEPNCNIKILNIANKYFNKSSCVEIIDINKEYSNTEIYQMKKPKIISIIINNGYPQRECSYFFNVPKLQILYKYIFRTKRNIFMNPQISTLIQIQSQENLTDVEEFLRNIWEVYRAPHVLIINKNCTFYKFKPFEYIHNQWGVLKLYSYEEINIGVSNKIDNLNAYPMNIIVFSSTMATKTYENATYVEYGGIDGLILKTLSERMNFTEVVLRNIPPADYGRRMVNGQFCGALKYLLGKQIEFISVSYFIKDYGTEQIEFSSSALSDDLCVVVRKGSKIRYWELYFIYYKIWLLLLVSFIIIATVWLLILQCETSITGRNNHRFCVFSNTLRLMLTVPFPRRVIIFSERIFLITCMLAMMTFLVDFQGYLVTLFTAPARYPDIKTLDELADTNFEIYTGFVSIKKDVFGEDENPVIQKLKKRIHISKNDGVFRENVLKGKAAEFMKKSNLVLGRASRYFDTEGILYVVDECPRRYSLAYILPRKSAFAPRINTLILRASQAGLFSKWYKDMTFNSTLSARRSRLDQSPAPDQFELKKFSIDEMVMGFYVFIIGHVISSVALVFEIVHCIVKKKISEKKIKK